MSAIQPYIILCILAIAMALFIWGRWRYDVVAIIALMLAVATGAVHFDQAYSGLSNSAVITVACVMVISQAISRSGILNLLARKLSYYSANPYIHIGSLSLITAVLSAFMNNVGALGIMMPIAIKTAIDSKRPTSMVLMPIALASALGGLTTVIGTPPNLLVSAYRQKFLGIPYAMFDFSYVGVATAIVGVAFITFIGWRLLPHKRKPETSLEDLFQVHDYISEIIIPESSPVAEMSVQELEKLTPGDFIIIGLIRNKRKKLVLSPHQQLQVGDILIIEASPTELKSLLDAGKLELYGDKKVSSDLLQSNDIALIEAVVPQASRSEGRSSKAMRLRQRFRMNLLAVSRAGDYFKTRLHELKLRAGDIVLLQGPAETINENIARLGLLPLIEHDAPMGKQPQAWLPLIIFAGAILLAAIQIIPIQIAFGGAVLMLILTNSMPARLVYDSIDWPVIVLLAAMIPIGSALQTTGGTQLITNALTSLAGHGSPILLLILVFIVTMTLSDFMNNAATAVVMAPIAANIAITLNLNADPFLMAVAISASCSFLTPLGHQNNTLVMGPGGYKFSDYIRLGLPLELIILAVAIPLILWAWPIY